MPKFPLTKFSHMVRFLWAVSVTVSVRFMMEEDYKDILFQHHLMTLYLTETQI